MYRSDQTHIALGGALMAVGFGGVIALYLGGQEGDWHRPGFLALFATLAFLAASGIYICAAVYVSRLPLPPTRAERELKPRLEVYATQIEFIGGADQLLFQIGLANGGRGRINGASVNVLVPAYLGKISRRDADANALEGPDRGKESSTPEHVELDENGDPVPSIYWNGFVDFPGRVARPLYFLTGVPPSGVLNVRVGVVAEELDLPLREDYAIRLPRETEDDATPQAELLAPAHEPERDEPAS